MITISLLLAVLPLGFGFPGHPNSVERDEQLIMWRIPSCDATNCTYLLLSSARVDVSWHDIHNALGNGKKTSLLAIKEILVAKGINAVIEKSNFGQLSQSNQRAIVLMDDPRSAGSNFIFIINADKLGVAFINGGAATVGFMSKEEFLRKWSGHALFIDRDDSQPQAESGNVLMSAIYFLMLVGGYLLIRVKS